jgi:hypothetical protein
MYTGTVWKNKMASLPKLSWCDERGDTQARANGSWQSKQLVLDVLVEMHEVRTVEKLF